jgi:hypothetical protein
MRAPLSFVRAAEVAFRINYGPPRDQLGNDVGKTALFRPNG